MSTRTERDSLGDIEVDDTALWGAQTERARHNFEIGSGRMPMPIIRALAHVKAAAAQAHARLGSIEAETAKASVAMVR